VLLPGVCIVKDQDLASKRDHKERYLNSFVAFPTKFWKCCLLIPAWLLLLHDCVTRVGPDTRVNMNKKPVKNRAYIRNRWIKQQETMKGGGVTAINSYHQLVAKLASSSIPQPRLCVPGEDQHVSFPKLNPVLSRQRRQRKKTKPRKARPVEEPVLADGLFIHYEDNTYLDRNSLSSRFQQRQHHAMARLLRRADATGNTFAAAKRRNQQPGRPRLTSDPPQPHIQIFERKTRTGQAKHSESKKHTKSLSTPPSSLVSSLSQDIRDQYSPVIEHKRAPLSGIWNGPDVTDFVRVAFDSDYVQSDASASCLRCVVVIVVFMFPCVV